MSIHPPGPFRDQRVIVPIMAVFTVFMVIVDGAITTVALPSLARQFHLTPGRLDSVVVIYPVCLGMVIPASAWLLERHDGRRVLLLGLTLFTLASGLCGAAQNLPQLVLFRALQGLAAGALTPVSQGLIFRTFTQHEQIRMSRIMIIPQQIAPAIAPLLGGSLVVALDWRWVFYVNVPVGLAAVVFGLFFLGEHRDGRASRLDLAGLLLSAAAMGSLMYGVCAGPDRGWATPAVLGSLASGAVLLGIAVHHQLRTDQPALRLRLFADRMFRRACLVSLLGLTPTIGAMFLVPLFVQQAQGHNAFASGSTTFTEAFGVLLTTQLASILYHRVGPGPIVGCGLLGVAGVELLFATSDAHTGLWTLRLFMFLLGIMMGAFFVPVTIASLTTLDRADSAQAATLGSVVRQTGMALAPTVVSSALVLGARSERQTAGTSPPVAAYQAAFLVLAGFAVLAALFALRLGRPRPNPGVESDGSASPQASADEDARTAGLPAPVLGVEDSEYPRAAA
ncbi:DHA2 family efflux MFS transporter permease subunit [Actinospica sp. MGRD01-02]|uniref:DHA2 family efflux MFS transporter permease subunit n=1 Tax=Actinospica acidithermotolerans TaxID=2828514 RepID=A0A941EF02_9ACTN|nr:DHA2 family efflux MFS transporter permease subunit [Actinospica acidithermotolerans]MBR7829315.1 DHA2 family efflux MFS transporter permease subunit [Actinospica acidithermotolerans]